MSTVASKSSRLTRDQNLIAGINKHLKGVTLRVAGQSLTAKQAVGLFQGQVDAISATTTAKANWQAAVKSEQTEMASTKIVAAAIRKAILIMFSQNADTLADFGLAPPKPRTPPTVSEKTARVAKARATRAARHTMGKKQKAAIKGVVPTTEPTVSVQQVQPAQPPHA